MEGKEKLWVPMNNLLKHVGSSKCKVSIFGVEIDSYNYTLEKFVICNQFLQLKIVVCS